MRKSHVVVVNWKDRTHPEAGGAEIYCEAMARELVALGFRVTYLTSRPVGTARRDEIDGYSVQRGGSTYSVYLFALLWLLRHRRDVDAVVDSQNGIPFFTPLVLRRSTSIALLIHHVHQDQFGLYFAPRVARIGRWLESTGSRWVYGPRPVAAVSPSSRTAVRKQLGLKGAIYVVPNGSTAVVSTPEHARAGVPTITCVGRLVPHKRWELLIELAAELRTDLPDLCVNLVGSGPEQARLAALVQRLGLESTVTLHGYVSTEVRDRLLAEAWLTVSTSVGEGWGLSVIEAAAVGVPAVALDVPGLRDSVRDGVTGWLAQDGHLGATVAAALEAVSHPVAAREYAERCRAWAASLTWGAAAERFHAIFAEEAARLDPGTRRRSAHSNDVATLVTLDRPTARGLDLRVLRATDQSTFCWNCLDTNTGPWRLLLHGCDERDALMVLARAGVDPREHTTELELCRSSELLTWAADGRPHSYVSIHGGLRCPAVRVRVTRPSIPGSLR
jgi:glycosyltransferase involved in cell wall biosynthesis